MIDSKKYLSSDLYLLVAKVLPHSVLLVRNKQAHQGG